MDTETKVGPATQDVAIELAYAKYMAALATHVPRPAAPFANDFRDDLPAPAAVAAAAPLKPAK
ncbi:hypothetical protein [Duganella qianjiadongensis]|uniref:Uncharacterized protein n=1 Tax=Duganella qianjiadongensis TaxID=2692176 RepID=A0ABW9VJK5_9BURK|nr:hypothetical protein [Duganella qianjiadongensis]MYM39090.1 hypothetical protein [Duganella qianjiadongensis]